MIEDDLSVSIEELRASLVDEIIKSVGLPRTQFWRKIFAPIFWLPTDRLSRVGANFDALVAKSGFYRAMRNLQAFFVGNVNVQGAEDIPINGPLLVVTNHPGTYDAVIVSAQVGRDDLKIVASDIPFIEKMKSASQNFLFAKRDIYKRMVVIKKVVSHLQRGGAVLIFPSGHIDPEPAFLKEAMEELDSWSRAIEIFLRKAPETTVQVGIVSNVLSRSYFKNPLTRLRKKLRDRQRIGEFLQVIEQLVFRKKFKGEPKVTFAPPFKLDDIGQTTEEGLNALLPYTIKEAKRLMKDHIN